MHGVKFTASREGQAAAALADILLRGLSQTRMRRLNTLLRGYPGPFADLPEGWPRILPDDAPLFIRLCCKLGEGAMRDQGASCSPYDSALARRSCSHAMASVRAHGPRSKARSTIRASPTMPPWRANIPAWPLRSARITSKPLIVA